MSRNTEHKFISTDTNEVLSLLIAGYEKVFGASVLPGSPEMLFNLWAADIIIQERVLNNYTGNQNVPSRASGENLDALGELVYQKTRPAAKHAVSTQRFRLSAPGSTSTLIPLGTRVTDAGGALIWATKESAYVRIGELSVDVPIECLTAGASGNGFATGQINTLMDTDNIRFFESCENITVSDGGSDVPDDDTFYKIMRDSQDAYSTAGPMGAYEFHAKNVSTEIADVAANSPKPGHVSLYVLMKGGAVAGEEIKNAVYGACNREDVRPLTDSLAMGDPETAVYDIDFTYFIHSRSEASSADIERKVQSAVEGYIAWQCGALGRDINPDELRSRVRKHGIKRIELRAPVFTKLQDGKGEGAPAPQVAAIRSPEAINIINGGYEDE